MCNYTQNNRHKKKNRRNRIHEKIREEKYFVVHSYVNKIEKNQIGIQSMNKYE